MKKGIEILGGKGASLGKMIKAGISVPPFFIVPAGRFDEKEILAEFKKLKTKYAAVRSSAAEEDSSTASWAGQLETYLNVGEKNLLKSIEKCRASINSPRAKAYRKQMELNKSAKGGSAFGGKISVAVIIQKMVKSEISGICFTANPVTGDRNEMIIEVGHGLGEKIVDGKITPKTYVIHRQFPKFPHKFKDLPNLYFICLKIEKLFKYPQDIEWAMAKGRIYILQSRPITTL